MAVLKKAVLMLAGHKETAKKTAQTGAVLLVALLFPLAAIMGVCTGKVDVDWNTLREAVRHSMAGISWDAEAADKAMEDVKERLEEAGAGEKFTDAQILYLLGLTEVPLDEHFAETFTGCLLAADDDEDTVQKINEAFHTEIRVGDFRAARTEWQTASPVRGEKGG